ncbi:MAG: aminotransferase class I/II-fold pyridoxal phosphate-dependent enzyme [Candidatus Eremiobacteraeota bacterium]|nr:aminotransferase class I/II-fold pyridoxal phosphate-dependent enzyme [Candidatus Eremiobacteraeota bacterium]
MRVENELERISREGRLRVLDAEEPKVFADFSSNDYLGLAKDSRMVEAVKHVKRVGAGGARLLGGRLRDHYALEQEIAKFLGRERALLFSSGYMAAVGVLPVLSRLVETAYSDELNHASLIDGLRLGRARRVVYAHAALPPKSTRSTPALVVTESLFGMNGDTVDVGSVAADLCDEDIMLVDEAHALGVLGPSGAGIAYGVSDPRIVIMGTLSKAFGAAGGFIAGPAPLIELFVNAARTFIFDTAMPAPIAFAARVGVMLAQTNGELRTRLHAKARRLREGLRTLGLPAIDGPSPIFSVVLGDERRALEVAAECLKRGVYAPAIRPPTVPPGTSRLRICVRADHTDEQIDALLDALRCTVIS